MKLFALSLSLFSRREIAFNGWNQVIIIYAKLSIFFSTFDTISSENFFFQRNGGVNISEYFFETLKVCSHQKPLYLKKIHWNFEQKKKKKNPSYIKILFHQEIKQCWNGFVSHYAIFIIDSISKEWNVKSIFFNKNRRKGNKNS